MDHFIGQKEKEVLQKYLDLYEKMKKELTEEEHQKVLERFIKEVLEKK